MSGDFRDGIEDRMRTTARPLPRAYRDTINEWLNEQDYKARARVEADSRAKGAPSDQRTLAFNALLRAALKWDDHTFDCWTRDIDHRLCTCGYDEKVTAQKELEELIAE